MYEKYSNILCCRNCVQTLLECHEDIQKVLFIPVLYHSLLFLVGKTNFHVSLVDNCHSRAMGLIGLHGVLGTNTQDIIISDPCTGEVVLSWKWYQFHQFHLQAAAQPSDEKMICVLHTSR